MSPEITILSTKKLTGAQREMLAEEGFMVLDDHFISTKSIEFLVKERPELLLFTSQNAVKSFIKNKDFLTFKEIPAICVGRKTASMLEENGLCVVASRDYASDLKDEVLPDFKNKKIAFFCGNKRMETIPKWLENNKVSFREYEVYKTTLRPLKIRENFKGILFYSPSGVESYLKKNEIKDEICFCIGRTTEAALVGITNNTVTARCPDTENVISCCIDFFSGNSEKNLKQND